jgi:hypothetical protein
MSNYTHLLKSEPSNSFIVKYLAEYLYIIDHNQLYLNESSPFKYDYIYITF